MTQWTPIIEQSEQLLSRIFEEDSAFLLFHDDADGCCAAAIMINLLSKIDASGFVDFASPEEHSVELTPKVLEKIQEKRPKFLVSLDLALTTSVDRINELLDSIDAEMMVYDHHVQSRFLNWSKRCVYLNPFDFDLGNKPASHYSYVIHNHYTKKRDVSWVAGTGVVADHRAEECRELLRTVKDNYPFLFPFEVIDQPSAVRSPLMTLGNLVNAGYQHSDSLGARASVEALVEALNANDPTMLLEGKSEKAALLHRFRREVDKELREYLEKFIEAAEFRLDSALAFYWMEPEFNITSQISNILQRSNPNTLICIIAPETRETLKVSLRRGKNVEVNLAILAESSTAGLSSASGGGHVDAAGCTIRNEDLPTWKDRTVQLVRSAHLQ